MKTHLITGGSGFVGGHIAQHLVARGERVIATYGQMDGYAFERLRDAVTFEQWFLGDLDRLQALLIKHQPDYIYHLASPAHVPTAQKNPRQTAMDVFIGTISVIDIVRSCAPEARLLYVGSAEEYADNAGQPLTETSRIAGASAYAISKAAATQWVAAMAKDFAVGVRPFNQIGPHQSPIFAVASFAAQIAGITLKEGKGTLRVGNLDVERDFIHVEDSSLAHIMALENGQPGEIYNIASGQPVRLRSLVEHMIKISGSQIEIAVDPSRQRPGEILRIVGDASKLQRATGWRMQKNALMAAEDALRAALASQKKAL